jgi:hypothetical protein
MRSSAFPKPLEISGAVASPKLRDGTLRIQDIFTLYVVNGAAATAAEPDDPTPSLSLFSCASPAACSPDFCAADTVRFIQLVEQA